MKQGSNKMLLSFFILFYLRMFKFPTTVLLLLKYHHILNSLPQSIDQVCGDQNIAKVWRTKSSGVLNSVADDSDEAALTSLIEGMQRIPIKMVTPDEVCVLTSGFPKNKIAGMDGIPSEFFKCDPVFVYKWVVTFINGVSVPSCEWDVCTLRRSYR